jgi:hypothetical protein
MSPLLLRRDSGEWKLLQSSTGLRQRDPSAGFRFALAYHRPLLAMCAALLDVHLPFYADDTHIVGLRAQATVAFEHLQCNLATLNLQIKLAKCITYSIAELFPALPIPPEFWRPPTASSPMAPYMVWSPTSTRYLGLSNSCLVSSLPLSLCTEICR